MPSSGNPAQAQEAMNTRLQDDRLPRTCRRALVKVFPRVSWNDLQRQQAPDFPPHELISGNGLGTKAGRR